MKLYDDQNKNKIKNNRSIVDSFDNAINGIVESVNTERNMRVHIFMAILILGLSILLDFTRVELILIAITIILVLGFELINTALETLTDLVTDGEYHLLAKKAKDISAGAVFVTSINAIFVGYLLIFPRISNLLKGNTSILQKVMESKEHLVLISIGIVLSLTVLLKGIFFKKNTTHLRGGTVSGHSALAFNLATIGTILVQNFLVSLILYAVALLVAQSRIEAKFHLVIETVFGAILGVLTALLIFYRFI